MKKLNFVAPIAAVLTLMTSFVFASGSMKKGNINNDNMAKNSMEKCKIIKNGKGMIKEHSADCKGSNHSCAGQNKEGDTESWIMVPKGECEKINSGNFHGVSEAIKNKIEGAKQN